MHITALMLFTITNKHIYLSVYDGFFQFLITYKKARHEGGKLIFMYHMSEIVLDTNPKFIFILSEGNMMLLYKFH